MSKAVQMHIDAISSRMVRKTNVIGMRKALAHVDRLRAGYSGNRSNATPEQADRIEQLLHDKRPTVLGELHDSGVKLLRSPRWRNRFTDVQRDIIGDEETGGPIRFDLIRFDRTARGSIVPVYCVVTWRGAFCFRNIPWQTAFYEGEESGPVVVPNNEVD